MVGYSTTCGGWQIEVGSVEVSADGSILTFKLVTELAVEVNLVKYNAYREYEYNAYRRQSIILIMTISKSIMLVVTIVTIRLYLQQELCWIVPEHLKISLRMSGDGSILTFKLITELAVEVNKHYICICDAHYIYEWH